MTVALDTEEIRSRLLREREELHRDILSLERLASELRSDRSGGDGGISNHMAEGASSTFDQERNLALLRNLRRTLNLVETALKRLDTGEYGRCEVCGKAIDRARLKTLPYATQCVECQARLETR